jgi:curved DNA-binding protein CbpA
MFVNGFNGNPGGPYLVSSVMLGRIGTGITVGAALFLAPNKVYGLAMGSIIGVLAYYVGFYAAKKIPEWQYQYAMGQQEQQRADNEDDDAYGFKPEPDSERTDDGMYRGERPQQSGGGAGADSSADGRKRNKERLEREYEESKKRSKKNESRTQRSANDTKGYYALLRVDRNASINEIRAGYRNQALTNHPDTGGSVEKMTQINEAYRVLRDEKRRAAYDAGRA